MNSANLSRKERERLMRRQAMLEAARAVFAEKGYANATLEEIAQRAEFGKGTLYNYFPGGKDELFFAVFEEVFAQFQELIDAAFTPAASFREGFEAFVRASFAFFAQHHEVLLLVMRESQRMLLSPEPERAAFFQDQYNRVVQHLSRHIQGAIERNEVKPLPPEAVAHTLIGNLHGIHMHLMLKACQHLPAQRQALIDSEAAAHFLCTLLLEGLLKP
ncbi:TetR/AcrR family transcriptional regulator [Rhodothermus bifroesti]|nr:TetR/AcrR family transcriptional regulator [Rhodothermus bifroesti]GBD02466.1 HTH-type transcriptional repressor KstR2 [bacterium HR18]